MKRLFLLNMILTGLFMSGLSFGQKVTPQQNNGKYYFQVANVYFEIDPSYGGRISSLKVDDKEILYVSRDFDYLWGSTFWQSPQSEWVWPPSTSLDQGPYTGGIYGDSVSLLSSVDDTYNTHLKFRKTFSADLSDSSVTIVYYMINTGTTAHSYSPWEITRVPSGGMAFFPFGSGSIAGDTAAFHLGKINGIVWFKYQGTEPPEKKFNSDGSEGWSAWINSDDVLFVKKFKDVPPGMNAPGENEIELYYEDSIAYIELENQGKYTSIQGGDSLRWVMKWYLRNLPTSIHAEVGDTNLVAYVRNIINHNDTTSTSNAILSVNKNIILVYPSPANDLIKITGLTQPSGCTIFDLSGKIMLEKTVGRGENTIEVSGLKEGFYLYHIDSPNFNYTGKIVIQR